MSKPCIWFYGRLTQNFATAILKNAFPSITCAVPFMKSMASEVSSPASNSTPSDDVLAFIGRIEGADPNSPAISEDDTNESWGHYQYTASALTCTTVLTSWDSIGNIDTACRLIAAAIKTCKVARHLCFARHISPASYLSDIYLQNIVELLLQLWSAMDGNKVRSEFSWSQPLTLVFCRRHRTANKRISKSPRLPHPALALPPPIPNTRTQHSRLITAPPRIRMAIIVSTAKPFRR